MGVILAGGRASRFGGAPKGLELVDGRRMIDAVADALRDAADELLLVANAVSDDRWLPGVRIEADIHSDIGSLGGLHAALAHGRGHDVLVVAWDMPFITSALLRALRTRGASGDVDAVLPRRDASARGEPLCAWYAHQCLTTADALIRSGERRAGALAGSVRTTWLEVAPFGAPSRLLANVNTPGELSALRGPATNDSR